MLNFVCGECRIGKHDECRLAQRMTGTDTWCDCQHRVKKEQDES